MILKFIFSRIKNDEGQGKGNVTIKLNTQDVGLNRTSKKNYEGRGKTRCGTT